MATRTSMPYANVAADKPRPANFRQDYAHPPGAPRSGQLGNADSGAITHAITKGGKRITQVSESTREGLRKRVAEAIQQHMSPAEAGQYVREWAGFDEYRAERIARTELMNSYNDAALGSYGARGVTQVVADDGDEDEECAARHGQVFDVDEAMSIEDHPNGTLDWLPVAPDIDARQVQGELNAQRPIREGNMGGEPPKPPPPPPVVEPPPVPEPPPVVRGTVSIPDATAQHVVEEFQDKSITMAHRIRGSYGTNYGSERGIVVQNDGGAFKVLSPRYGESIDPAHLAGIPDPLGPGQTLVVLEPHEGSSVVMGMSNVQDALTSGGNIRRFNVEGRWVEIRPAGVQQPLSLKDVERFHAAVQREVDAGVKYADAYPKELARVLGDRAQVSFGQFEPTVARDARLAAEKLANETAAAESRRLAAQAGSKWAKASKQDVVEGIRSGRVSLDTIAEERWGWRGGTPGTDTAGKFVVRGRKGSTPFTLEHEVAFARAYEDSAEIAGGFGRFQVDQVIFANTGSQTAAADYGMAGYHTSGKHLVTTSRIKFFKGTAAELNTATRSEYQGVNDFYSTAVHELGHALDYGSVVGRNEWDSMVRAALGRGQDSIGRLESQLPRVKQELRAYESTLEDTERRYLADAANPNISDFERTYRAQRLESTRAKIAALKAQADALQQQIDEAYAELKRLGKEGDRLMTQYSKKNGREAWAEAWWFYVNKPEQLRQRAPGLFDFMRDTIQGTKAYHPG